MGYCQQVIMHHWGIYNTPRTSALHLVCLHCPPQTIILLPAKMMCSRTPGIQPLQWICPWLPRLWDGSCFFSALRATRSGIRLMRSWKNTQTLQIASFRHFTGNHIVLRNVTGPWTTTCKCALMMLTGPQAYSTS